MKLDRPTHAALIARHGNLCVLFRELADCCTENDHFSVQILKSPQFFGKFGEIKQLTITPPISPQDTCTVNITYTTEDAATACMDELNGSFYYGFRIVFAILFLTSPSNSLLYF